MTKVEPIVVSFSELDTLRQCRNGKPSLREPNSMDIAWAAGFLEGDGTFYKRPNHGSIFVQVHQVNQEPLYKLQEIFGGNISQLKAKGTHSPKGVWTVNGDRAVAVMALVWPLMSQKRRAQIERALPEGVEPTHADQAYRSFV